MPRSDPLSLVYSNLDRVDDLGLNDDIEGDLDILRNLHLQKELSSENTAPSDAQQGDQEQKQATAEPDAIADYYGIRLSDEDIKLLSGDYWVNDNIISFYFNHLEHEVFGKHKALLILQPSIAFMLMLCSGDSDFRNNALPLSLHTRDVVLIPVTDQTHWGLLMISVASRSFRYFDSLSTPSSQHSLVTRARQLARRLAPYVWMKNGVHDDNADYDFVVEPTPQQTNMHDCGLYAMAVVDLLCERFFADEVHSLETEIHHPNRNCAEASELEPLPAKKTRPKSSLMRSEEYRCNQDIWECVTPEAIRAFRSELHRLAQETFSTPNSRTASPAPSR